MMNHTQIALVFSLQRNKQPQFGYGIQGVHSKPSNGTKNPTLSNGDPLGEPAHNFGVIISVFFFNPIRVVRKVILSLGPSLIL
jgi:hypothetical protein